MKRRINIVICFLVLLLYACAAANTSKNVLPPDPIAGMNALNKGAGLYQKGCYPQALEHFFKAHERFSASDHMAGTAMSLNNIGNVYRAAGDLESALLFYEEACLTYLDLKDQQGALHSLSNKAAALIDADRFREANNELMRAEKLVPDSSKRFGPLLRNRGVLLSKKGEYSSAQDILDAALKNTDSSNLPDLAAVHFALGTLMAKTNRPDEAIGHFKTALSADRSSSYYNGTADDLAAIGSVLYRRGDVAQAVGFLKRAVKIYALIRNRPKLEAARDLLLEASQKAGMNIELTEFFVERWDRGEATEIFCR